MNKKLQIEIAYARPDHQEIITLQVASGTTIEIAIHESGILAHFPEIDLDKQKVGVFSQLRELTDLVKAGDRIEIYRPLTLDPKESRRKKAKS